MTAASVPPTARPLDPARSRLVRSARHRLTGAGCLLTFSWVSFDVGHEEGARAVLRLVLALVEHAAAAVLLVAALVALARASRGLGRRRAPRLGLALAAAAVVLFPLLLSAALPAPSVGPSSGPDLLAVVLAVLASLPFLVGRIVVAAWGWPPLTTKDRPEGGASPGRRRLRVIVAAGALTVVVGIIDRLRMGEVIGSPAPNYLTPVGLWQALGLPGFVPLGVWTIVMLAVSARWSRPVQHGLIARLADTRRGAVTLGAALVYLVAASQYLTLFGPFFVYVFVPIPLPDQQLHVSPVYGTLAHAALLVAALSSLLPTPAEAAEGPEDLSPLTAENAAAPENPGRHGAAPAQRVAEPSDPADDAEGSRRFSESPDADEPGSPNAQAARHGCASNGLVAVCDLVEFRRRSRASDVPRRTAGIREAA